MNNNHKLALGITALAGAGAILVGLGFAFFSDVISGSGSATAGTLDITGTVTLEQNGTAVDGNTVENFNPGDIISFDVSSLANAGNKSAWIRGVFEFTNISTNLADHLWVCTNGETQSSLIAASLASTLGTEDTASCEQAAVNTVIGAKETYTLANDVIAGTGENAETEGNSSWSNTTNPIIYFDALAGNDAQDGTLAFDFLIQALQYKNNTTSPDETKWETVVDTAFSL